MTAAKKMYETNTFTIKNYDPEASGWVHSDRIVEELVGGDGAPHRGRSDGIYLGFGSVSGEKPVQMPSLWFKTPGGGVIHGVVNNEGVVKLKEKVKTYTKTGTVYTPPPGPFDDVPENRKAHQKEAAAIRKVMDYMLTFDTKAEAVEVLRLTNPAGYGITVKIGEDLPILDQLAQAEELFAFVKNFDPEVQKRILRHTAHAFDIGKGETWLR